MNLKKKCYACYYRKVDPDKNPCNKCDDKSSEFKTQSEGQQDWYNSRKNKK